MSQHILTFETTLAPDEVLAATQIFFTNERWTVESESSRVVQITGRPPIPWFKLALTIAGYLWCIVPGIIMHLLMLRQLYRLHTIVVAANPTAIGSRVLITLPSSILALGHRFFATLPPAQVQSPSQSSEGGLRLTSKPQGTFQPTQIASSTPTHASAPSTDIASPTALVRGSDVIQAGQRVALLPREHLGVSRFVHGSLENRRAGLIFASVAVILLVGITAFAIHYVWFSNRAIEQELDAAITRGELFQPEGKSAYDFYHDLKNSGADAKTLAPFEDRLLPLLTTLPFQIISSFAVPTNAEPPVSEWQNALTRMQWACQMRPNDNALNAREQYIKGRLAFISNKKDQALEFWKKAGDLDRTWAMPLNGVGVIYNEKKNFETARKYLFEAIRREANWAVPYNSVGTSYFFEKKYDDAWTYYMKAIERSPNWARPHAWLGDVAMRRDDFVTAADEYQKALDLAQSGNTSLDLNDLKKRLDQAKKKSQERTDSEIIN